MFEEYPQFSSDIFTFSLDVVGGDIEQSINDERIGLTIVEIFRAFFTMKENVAIYICESTDDRHLARKRKFDFWFWKFNDGSTIKEDCIAVIDNVEIYNSLLVHENNSYQQPIINAFRELNSRAGEK